MRVVSPRVAPDVDGVACAVAYAELLAAVGTPSVAVITGTPDAEARFVRELVGVELSTEPPASFTGVVLVDASERAGLPAFVDPAAVVEVIDHRLHHEAHRLFPSARVQIEAVGAAATLVFERFEHANVSPSRAAAWLLQAAIESNTQRLRGSVTTQRDLDAMARLRQVCPMPAEAIKRQFRARRDEIVADLGAAMLREAKSFDDPEGTFVISQLEGPGVLELVEVCSQRSEVLGTRAMINLVDPLLPASAVVVPDARFRAWVGRRAGLLFEDAVSTHPEVLLRKQLVARIGSTR